jgi:hypothetical protein
MTDLSAKLVRLEQKVAEKASQDAQERRAKWNRIQAADPTLAALLRAARAKFEARVVELYIGEERVL